MAELTEKAENRIRQRRKILESVAQQALVRLYAVLGHPFLKESRLDELYIFVSHSMGSEIGSALMSLLSESHLL